VWKELLGLVRGAQGDRARMPSQKTVGRWLDRWVQDGLMVTDHRGGLTSGRPPLIYRTSRALSLNSCPLSSPIPEFFQGKGSSADKSVGVEQDVRTEVAAPEDATFLPDLVVVEPQLSADTEKSVHTKNAVTEGDLGRVRPEDTHNRTTCARARQSEAVLDDEEDGGYDAKPIPRALKTPLMRNLI